MTPRNKANQSIRNLLVDQKFTKFQLYDVVLIVPACETVRNVQSIANE